MYLVVSIPQTNESMKIDEQVVEFMEARGFSSFGVSLGTISRDHEFENNLQLDDESLDIMESDLRQLINEQDLRLFVESE